jgi:hypothetical protein
MPHDGRGFWHPATVIHGVVRRRYAHLSGCAASQVVSNGDRRQEARHREENAMTTGWLIVNVVMAVIATALVAGPAVLIPLLLDRSPASSHP